VLSFCAGLPIVLIGCKKDLRNDLRAIEDLHRTGQCPVTPQEVKLILILNFHVNFNPFRSR
jgi:Ras homolog gene family, member A